MSFVQSYCTAFAGENTDPLFNRACSLFALSTGLQRRIWTRSGNKYTFPNLYMLLVANSGAGKGEALDPLKSLVSTMKDGTIHLAAASVTAASLADALQKALVTYVSRKGVSHQYHALTIISDEFGVFIPEYDKIKLARLTHLYDQKGYSETTRGGINIEIENHPSPCLAPAHLHGLPIPSRPTLGKKALCPECSVSTATSLRPAHLRRATKLPSSSPRLSSPSTAKS